ncbi:MAG: rhodanese-like domain-containing protein [Acidobacteria bacterium]|nr:rhodanese-like domain-containing protein [Acidobacteriota bacterium]
MRKCSLATAAVLCLAAVVLFAACKAGDGAGASRASATPAAAGINNPVGATATPPVAPQTVATPADDVRRVTIPEVQKMMETGEAVLVDVRDENSYKNGHIKGALSIPRGELVVRMKELPKDKLVVFYCA